MVLRSCANGGVGLAAGWLGVSCVVCSRWNVRWVKCGCAMHRRGALRGHRVASDSVCGLSGIAVRAQVYARQMYIFTWHAFDPRCDLARVAPEAARSVGACWLVGKSRCAPPAQARRNRIAISSQSPLDLHRWQRRRRRRRGLDDGGSGGSDSGGTEGAGGSDGGSRLLRSLDRARLLVRVRVRVRAR
eukprot:scaffold8777_cov48-Phaeocystis_antarctica.AAC.3